MYMLVPEEPYIGFVTLAVIFVAATLLGFASHSPGGLGVFDAAMLVGLWQMDREDLLAGMLLFRVLYYIAPFVISVILLTFRELILGARRRQPRRSRSVKPSTFGSGRTPAPEVATRMGRRGTSESELRSDGNRRFSLFLFFAVAGPAEACGHHFARRRPGACGGGHIR
jgi:hypothetical protein